MHSDDRVKLGRIALVTGGAKGVGALIAERLATDGFTIVLCDLAEAELEAAAAVIRVVSPESKSFRADVSDEKSVRAMMAAIESWFGRLDVLVNNAAILGLVDGKVPSVVETSLESWEAVLRVNLTGPFLVSREAVRLMRKNRWGRIINISSRSAHMPLGVPAYGTSKTGLVGFSRYLAKEVGPDGITVNCIAPSRMSTKMTEQVSSAEVISQKLAEIPLGRLALPEDVAATAAFLASEGAKFITGTVIDVNGGSYMS